MTITLGELRQYCSDHASPDSAGTSADREFMVWINAALEDIYTEFEWDHLEHKTKILLEKQEEVSTLGLTEGSKAITLSGADTFASKYVSEEWELFVEGEGDEVFRLESIDDSPTNQNATMKDGDEWTNADASNKTAYFVKTRYSLPTNCLQVVRCQVIEPNFNVRWRTPAQFDVEKAAFPKQKGTYPYYFTTRQGKLEVWPPAADEYFKLGISYRKGVTRYSTSDDDSTEIDWEEKYRDLLQKAILVQACISQGEEAPVPLGAAAAFYEKKLKLLKALDVNRVPKTGPMGLDLPNVNVRGLRPRDRSASWRINSE